MTSEAPADPTSTPPPTFDVLPLSPETRESLAEMGYTHPTPVQRAVFEPACRGLDLVVQARTGTGKTTAFGLPIIESLVRRSTPKVQAIVLCPTRELALQISAEVGRLGKKRQIEPVAIYGGAPMDKQSRALADGAQVVVGTPGRVLDHLSRGTLDPSAIRLLVLDEADEMLSMGFERELSAILERLPKERQTLLFSATLPPDIERMARDRLKQPEFITLSGDHIGALEILHFVYLVHEDKLNALIGVLEVENPESALVFCNTKAETERVAERLQGQGFVADWLNGDLPQGEREKIMSRTREGKLRFLVATDVAARGIDISHLTHVINYDFPDSPERYVHRTGRTGRAGRTGTAIALVTPKDIGNVYLVRLLYGIRPIEKSLPSTGELKTRAEADLVQMLADAFLPRPIHADDRALARRLLSHDDAENIVAGLLRDHLGARPEAAEEAAAARRSLTRSSPRNEETARPAVRSRSAASPPRGAPAGRRVDERPRPEGRSRPDERPRRDAGPRSDTPADDAIDLPRYTIGSGSRTVPSDTPTVAEQWSPSETLSPSRLAPAKVPALSPDGDGRRGDAAGPAEEPPTDLVEIFVGVGRRDGIGAADIERVLVEQAGIEPAHGGRVRVRDRNAFVSIHRDLAERALAALRATPIGGKVQKVEVARPRSGRSSSTNDT